MNQHADYSLLRTNRTHVVGATARSIYRLVRAGVWPEAVMAFWAASSKVGRRAGLSTSRRELRKRSQHKTIFIASTPDQVRPFDFKGPAAFSGQLARIPDVTLAMFSTKSRSAVRGD